ncbi:MAG: hypothetical protein WC879_08640 [Melioribacteraceae bacterium]
MSKRSITILICVLLITTLFGQPIKFPVLVPSFNKNDLTNLKKIKINNNSYWYFSGTNYKQDKLNSKYTVDSVLFNDSVFVIEKRILKKHEIKNLINSDKLTALILNRSIINDQLQLSSLDGTFARRTINKNLVIRFSILNEAFIESNLDFEKKLFLENSFFKNGLSLMTSNFSDDFKLIQDTLRFTQLLGINFNKYSDITSNIFESEFHIMSARFYKRAYLNSNRFNKLFSISSTKFKKSLDLSQNQFMENVNFTDIIVIDTLDLAQSTFQNGIDLRFTNLDSVKTIYLDGTIYPMGKLYIYWHQLKAKNNPRIQLKFHGKNPYYRFSNLEDIYLKLRDNYLAQGDKVSADDVMYELEWQRDICMGGFFQRLYGLTMGYGYRPYFYLWVIFIFVSTFSLIWYYFYYSFILKINSKNIEADLSRPIGYLDQFELKGVKLFGKTLNCYDHSKSYVEINRLEKFWHVIIFSVSVLLGLRFKKEWIKVSSENTFGRKTFLKVVTLEYAIGITLIILFAVGVKTSQFSFIKGIFGL